MSRLRLLFSIIRRVGPDPDVLEARRVMAETWERICSSRELMRETERKLVPVRRRYG